MAFFVGLGVWWYLFYYYYLVPRQLLKRAALNVKISFSTNVHRNDRQDTGD